MKKPVKSEGVAVMQQVGYDVHEIINFIGKKYKIDPYDYLNSLTHFDEWADKKGYKDTDPQGKKRSHSQIWFAEYNADPEGEAKRPEYQCFIHWFTDLYAYDYDESFDFSPKDHLQDKDLPEYVQTILKYIQKEFGDDIECYYSEA